MSEDCIVCPWCGHRDEYDLHEYFTRGRSTANISCVECGKLFEAEVEYTAAYWTNKVTCYSCGVEITARTHEHHGYYYCSLDCKTAYAEAYESYCRRERTYPHRHFVVEEKKGKASVETT